jgi:hypothetical protein
VDLQATPVEKIWLGEMMRSWTAGKPFKERETLIKLRDKLPPGFVAANVRSEFGYGDSISALGVYAVDPTSKLLVDADVMIRKIAEWIKTRDDFTQVQAKTLAEELGLQEIYAGRLLFLITTMGSFCSGGNSQPDRGMTIMHLERQDNVAEFLAYQGIEPQLKKNVEQQRASTAASKQSLALFEGKTTSRRLKVALPRMDTDSSPMTGIVDPELLQRCGELFSHLSDIERPEQMDTVLSEATKVLEVRLRRACSAPDKSVGTDLASFALGGPSPRISIGSSPAEQDGAHSIYRGIFGFIRNRVHHKMVPDIDPGRALQVIGFIDYLLSLIPKQSANESGSGDESDVKT